MNVDNCKKRPTTKRTILISLKISAAASRWMKENNFSPTGIFNEALKELGFKEDQTIITMKEAT